MINLLSKWFQINFLPIVSAHIEDIRRLHSISVGGIKAPFRRMLPLRRKQVTMLIAKRCRSSTSYLLPDSAPALDSLTKQSEGRGGEDEQRRGESRVELSGAGREQSGTERNREAGARPQHIPNIKDESGTRH